MTHAKTNELWRLALDERYRYPMLRIGQSLMNVLCAYDFDAYKLCMVKCDPFYNDELVPSFLDFLNNHW